MRESERGWKISMKQCPSNNQIQSIYELMKIKGASIWHWSVTSLLQIYYDFHFSVFMGFLSEQRVGL